MSDQQAVLLDEIKAQEQNKENKNEMVSDFVDEMGIISDSTKVVGKITTSGHVGVAGVVEGDIIAKGNVIVSGVVKGTISCQNLMVEEGKVTAEVKCSGQVVIKEGTFVTGNITCKDLSSGGTITGNVDAVNQVGLASTAVMNGDVSATQVGVELGAKLNGRIQTK